MRRALAATCAVALACAVAGFDDPERLEVWEVWREDPIDLREAPESDLALLPGSDPTLAAALVALRRDRPDFGRDDLLRLEGVDTHRLEEWEALACWHVPRGLRVDATHEVGVDRIRLRLRRGAWNLGVVARSTPRLGRLALSGRVLGTDLIAGALRPTFGAGTAVGDALGRSRTGPVRGPRAGRVRGRTDTSPTPGWRGLALRRAVARGHVTVVAGRDPTSSPSWIVHWETRDRGLVAIGGRRPTRIAGWTRHAVDDATDVWAEAGAGPDLGSGVTSTGVRRRGPGWSLEAGWTRAGRAVRDGRDPVTGAALDRPHTVWQLHGRVREGPLRFEGTLRHRRRADARDRRVRADLVWTRPRRHDDAPRWRVRLGAGVDERPDDGITHALLRTEGERTTSRLRVRLAWSHRGVADDPASAITLRVRRRGVGFAGVDAEVGLGAATADRSSPWAVVRPLAGARPLWVPGAGHAAWVALSAGEGPLRAGAWLWWRGPVDDGATGGGLAVRYEAGAVVRRLQTGR